MRRCRPPGRPNVPASTCRRTTAPNTTPPLHRHSLHLALRPMPGCEHSACSERCAASYLHGRREGAHSCSMVKVPPLRICDRPAVRCQAPTACSTADRMVDRPELLTTHLPHAMCHVPEPSTWQRTRRFLGRLHNEHGFWPLSALGSRFACRRAACMHSAGQGRADQRWQRRVRQAQGGGGENYTMSQPV